MTQTLEMDESCHRKPPIIYWFKSVAFLLKLNSSRSDFTIPTDVLASWIRRFDDWYKKECGILDGRQLHFLYHREISVIGSELLHAERNLETIGMACRERGYGYSITVDINEALEYSDEFNTLITAGVLSNVGLVADEKTVLHDKTSVCGFVETIMQKGLQIGLIGSVHYFQSIGLLNSPIFNASDTTIYPVGNTSSFSAKEQAIIPCFSRFRIYVDVDGNLYPCLGLMGIEDCSMGSVYDDISETVFGRRPTVLDFDRMACHGPNLDDFVPDELVFGLPWICERHRHSFLPET